MPRRNCRINKIKQIIVRNRTFILRNETTQLTICFVTIRIKFYLLFIKCKTTQSKARDITICSIVIDSCIVAGEQ